MAEIQFDSVQEQYPRSYTLSLSTDGTNWSEVASGTGVKGDNVIRIEDEVMGKFIRMQVTEQSEQPWAMRRLNLYAR